MIDIRAVDRRVAARVLRGVVGAPRRLTVVRRDPTDEPDYRFACTRADSPCIVYETYETSLSVCYATYDTDLFGTALGRYYALQEHRYERRGKRDLAHLPPTWEERLVERDRVEYTTAAAMHGAP